jgi:hypothetical protein
MHGRRGRDLPVRHELRQRMGHRSQPQSSRSTSPQAQIGTAVGDAQRATVKAHVSRHRPATARANLVRHGSYLAREQASLDGKPGTFFDVQGVAADGKERLASWAGDRHHFRIILAPEGARDLPDMAAYTREVMRRAQQDLKTPLSWVAVAHHNTDHPHVHMVLRGRTAQGRDLVIPRDYLAEGLRRRAAEVATEYLGPRQRVTPVLSLDREVRAHRFTRLDALLDTVRKGDRVDLATSVHVGTDVHDGARVAARLAYLERVGLAQKDKGSAWYVDPQFGPALRQWARREALLQRVQKVLGPQAARVQLIERADAPLRGVVVATGRAGALVDDRFVVVRTADGSLLGTRISDTAESRRMAPGSVVEVGGAQAYAHNLRAEVRTIAGARGVYSGDAHREHLRAVRPQWPAETVEGRVRQTLHLLSLAAERLPAAVRREAPERFSLVASAWNAPPTPPRHSLRVLSALPLDQQVAATAPTWLDRQMRRRGAGSLLHHPDIARAAAQRQAWLVSHGYAPPAADKASGGPSKHGTARLKTAEQVALSEKLAAATAGPAWHLSRGSAVSGTYQGIVELPSGPRAVVAAPQGLHVARVRRAPEVAPGTFVRFMNSRDRGVEVFPQPALPAKQQQLSRGHGLGL